MYINWACQRHTEQSEKSKQGKLSKRKKKKRTYIQTNKQQQAKTNRKEQHIISGGHNSSDDKDKNISRLLLLLLLLFVTQLKLLDSYVLYIWPLNRPYGQWQLVMVNYACGVNQSAVGKYFEWIIINN